MMAILVKEYRKHLDFNLAPSLQHQVHPGRVKERTSALNREKSIQAVEALIDKIKKGKRDQPSIGMMVPFMIFRYVSKPDKDLMAAEFKILCQPVLKKSSRMLWDFNSKIDLWQITFGVNMETGFWQGMYQWKSEQALEDYKQSFVYRMMNRRAVDDSISSKKFPSTQLLRFVEINKS